MSQAGRGFFRFLKHPNAAMVALIVVNLVAGLIMFQDFGPSWDEPLFYGYADALGYAYSIQPRLDGTFDITNSYGPSSDHAMYGPAYLLLGRSFVYLAEDLSGLDRGILWHAVNFVFFQIGLVFLYLLARRWLSSWAAFASVVFFSTQPLLWGHAFINPKDIPFTVFFTAAIYAGLRFIDGYAIPVEPLPDAEQEEKAKWQAARRGWLRAGAVLLVLALILLALDPLLRSLIKAVMAAIYNADAGSLAGRAFRSLAEDAGKVDVSYYAGVLIHYYKIARIALLILFAPLIAIAAAWWRLPERSQRFCREIRRSLASIVFWERGLSFRRVFRQALFPGILLGLVIAVRVLGPLVALLVGFYFLLGSHRRPIGVLLVYGAIALVTTYLCWPYLWADPVGNFMQVWRHMADNPVTVRVLFGGVEYKSVALPAAYLPTLLGINLTEPVWPLTLAGLAIASLRMIQKKIAWRDFSVLQAWFVLPFLYVIFTQPPMYDGFRHFLFILPPVFIVAGMVFQWIREWTKRPWLRWLLLALAVLPGILGIASMHPYEYAYFNSFVGGPAGAFHRYDADYWLTCYKEALQPINEKARISAQQVLVPLQASLAGESAVAGVKVLQFERSEYKSTPGDYFLLTTRFNYDQLDLPPSEVAWTVGRGGAQYCVVKQIR
jgi:hypothetical protein